MGSTGTGRFSDYSGTPNGRASGGGAGGGGSSNPNNCENAIGDIELEEVGRCPYFQTNNLVPIANSVVSLNQELVDGRLAILVDQSGLVIGYLPKRYNYLRACMTEGFSYAGVVTSVVGSEDFPRIWVDLAPSN